MSYHGHGLGAPPLITHFEPPIQRLHAYGITEPAYGRKMIPGTSFGGLGGPVPSRIANRPLPWPDYALGALKEMCRKYGPPDSMSPWGAHWWRPHGVWKRSVVLKHGYPHRWPKPHMDVLLQTIDYRVPPSAFTKLAMYDGSVVAERTAGEMSARCGGEKMNFVALNLAHDVVTGKRTVEGARREYTRLAKLVGNGKVPAYAKGLQFAVPSGYQGDPDQPASGLSGILAVL